jgi:hypothetical protein
VLLYEKARLLSNTIFKTVYCKKHLKATILKTVYCEKHLKARAIFYCEKEATNNSFTGFGSGSSNLIHENDSGFRINHFCLFQLKKVAF